MQDDEGTETPPGYRVRRTATRCTMWKEDKEGGQHSLEQRERLPAIQSCSNDRQLGLLLDPLRAFGRCHRASFKALSPPKSFDLLHLPPHLPISSDSTCQWTAAFYYKLATSDSLPPSRTWLHRVRHVLVGAAGSGVCRLFRRRPVDELFLTAARGRAGRQLSRQPRVRCRRED
jgi:hypothetical protein